jgi:pyruvate/oxaloacetate carboxyltransferase
VFCLRHDKGEEEEEEEVVVVAVCKSGMVGEKFLNEKQNTLREIA